jgi:hypothetical protein
LIVSADTFPAVATALLALFLNKSPAITGNIPNQNWFSALGCPDQMIDDQVEAVFISLVFHYQSMSYIMSLLYSTFYLSASVFFTCRQAKA